MAEPASKSGDSKPAADKSPATSAAPGAVGKALAMLKAFKWPIIGSASALTILSVGSYWYFFRETRPDPPVLLTRALECLKDRENAEATVEARRIASELDALHYRDPQFGGAVPYILGIVEFRKAQQQTDRQRLESLRSAAAHLEQAVHNLDAEHRLEGEFTLGIARSAIGDVSGAQQPLQRVVKDFLTDKTPTPPPEFFEAAATLENGYLDVHTPSSLLAAIRLNEAVLAKKNLERTDRDRALLRRAQAFVALHDGEQARAAI